MYDHVMYLCIINDIMRNMHIIHINTYYYNQLRMNGSIRTFLRN